MPTSDRASPPRVIPSLDRLARRPGVVALEATYGRAAVVDALRGVTDALRAELVAGTLSADEAERRIECIEAPLAAALEAALAYSLVPVINATGIVIHTNLARAPLAEPAIARIGAVARGYCNLEYDLDRGVRGSRETHAERLLVRLTGAEAAAVANNNAAAVLLILNTLAEGREVVISRGELIEIGGSFRIPDVMTKSGAVLREVGTTNKTRLSDYEAAITDRTGLILRVHPSNFRIVGFTERPALEALVRLGRARGIPIAEDLGSGNVRDLSARGLADEPTVQASLAAGVDLACFSGDKLLGGPQAGIIAGRAGLVKRVRKNPLMRALRVDKLTYAALEATLVEYVKGRGDSTVPVQAMIAADPVRLAERARAFVESAARRVGEAVTLGIENSESMTGGGSAPGIGLPSPVIAVRHATLTADAVLQHLRRHSPPIIARIEEDRVLIDLRTVFPQEEPAIQDALATLAPDGRLCHGDIVAQD